MGDTMCKEVFCEISRKLGTVCPKMEIVESIIYKDDPAPITPCGTISIALASSICLDVIEQYGGTADLFLPDISNKVYRYADVANDECLLWTDSLKYITEEHDCDDFAAKLFGKWAGLVWTDTHALNWFIDENEKFWFIEPQTRYIFDKLNTGTKLRFLLGR